MSTQTDLRTRKRIANRDAISHAATRLFVERGFDNVTVDEIAAAANVGRKTVFNHFPRKEDMFFDLEANGREDLLQGLKRRRAGTSPIEALRELAHMLVAEERSYIRFFPMSPRFIETIEASETLKARARAIRDDLAQLVAGAIAQIVGRDPSDPDAHLAANLLVTTWSVAFIQAHKIFKETGSREKANATFLFIVDRGTHGANASLEGTPYASPIVAPGTPSQR